VAYACRWRRSCSDFYTGSSRCRAATPSLDYEFDGYRPGDVVKLDILLNDEPATALGDRPPGPGLRPGEARLNASSSRADPPSMFQVSRPGAIGSRSSRARPGASARRSSRKCYGGDITRKRKLLEKQKEGKRRMKADRNLECRRRPFLAVLQRWRPLVPVDDSPRARRPGSSFMQVSSLSSTSPGRVAVELRAFGRGVAARHRLSRSVKVSSTFSATAGVMPPGPASPQF